MTATTTVATPGGEREVRRPAPSDPQLADLARWAWSMAPEGHSVSRVLMAAKILRDRYQESGESPLLSVLVPAVRWAQQQDTGGEPVADVAALTAEVETLRAQLAAQKAYSDLRVGHVLDQVDRYTRAAVAMGDVVDADEDSDWWRGYRRASERVGIALDGLMAELMPYGNAPKRCDCSAAGKWGATGVLPEGHIIAKVGSLTYLAHAEAASEGDAS